MLDFSVFSVVDLAVIFATVIGAYVIFGMVGFGTALIASPILLNFMSLSEIIPLLALLDMFAAISNMIKDGKSANFVEIKNMFPYMALGILVGFFILMNFNPKSLLLAFGIFIIGYSLYSLSGFKAQREFTTKHAIPFGFFGGLFGVIFGSGGFLYALYLGKRMDNPNLARITQTTLIGFSTFCRFGLFAFSGVYFSAKLLSLFALILPAMLIGMFIGKRITLRLSKAQFLKIINILILASGIAIVVKFCMMNG